MLGSTIPTLRPLSVGEIFDQAIRLYRRHFITFVGIIALVQIPYTIFQAVISATSGLQVAEGIGGPPGSMDYGTLFSAQMLSYLAALVQLILVEGIGTAALTRAIADTYLGRPVSIVEAYKSMGRSWVGLVGALLLVGLIGLGFLIWTIIPCVGWLTGIGMMVFLGLAVRPLVTIVYVVEKKGAVKSFRRAWDLAKRRFWWLIGFTLLLSLFATLVIYGPTTLFASALQSVLGIDAASSYTNPQIWFISLALTTFMSLVGSLIYLPLQLTANTLVYFDLRVRTEGFDLSVLAADVGDAQDDILRTAPTVPNESFITTRDLGNFFALSIIGFVFYAGIVGVFAAIGMLMASGGGL
ncbi:MAG: hypothetical protein ACOYYS_26745 [Chloroflexota bacterium]